MFAKQMFIAPSSWPFDTTLPLTCTRYSGTPPALVTMPVPQPEVSMPAAQTAPGWIERARGMHFPASNGTLKSQPRFVLPMPYSAPLGVFVMPGGKWMSLMKRTVREESGAWLWLKNAAVRATPTASSSLAFETPARRKTASGRPARSTTAMVSCPSIAPDAPRTMVSTSVAESDVAAVPPSAHWIGAGGGSAQPGGSALI